MIGTDIGIGVRGSVIAAMQTAEDSHVVVILVRVVKWSGIEYVTALMAVDIHGRLIGEEWDSGRYHSDLTRALVNMAERSGQVPHKSLNWNN